MFRIPDPQKKLGALFLNQNKRIRITKIYDFKKIFITKEFNNIVDFLSELKRLSSTQYTMFEDSYFQIYPEKRIIVAPETFSGDDDNDWYKIIADFEYF